MYIVENVAKLLANQVDNIGDLLVEYYENVISGNIMSNDRFENRICSIARYVVQLHKDYENDFIDEDILEEKMLTLMNKIVEYRNCYNKTGFGYRSMNSMIDVVRETYIEIYN